MLRRLLYQLTFLNGLYYHLYTFFENKMDFWQDLYLWNGRVCFGCFEQDGMHEKECWVRDFWDGGPPQGMRA